MHGKRHGAVSAVLALLTLLSALFCATTASPAPSRGFSTTAGLHALGHERLEDAGRDAPAAADAPCLKKTQPERKHLRSGAPLARALPTETGDMASVRASAHMRQVRCCGPAPSPPDLAELSVRRT